jgi:nucleoside phosphorylase
MPGFAAGPYRRWSNVRQVHDVHSDVTLIQLILNVSSSRSSPMEQLMPVEAPTRSNAEKLPEVWGDVPPKNPHFTGRQGLLDDLHQRLSAGSAGVLPQALHGMGGVGKTQLAVEFVHRHRAEYDLVWWIPAEHEKGIRRSFVHLASRLTKSRDVPEGDAVAVVREALSTGQRHRRKWLLVFDNAENPQQVREYFPTGGVGHILITSRNSTWRRAAGMTEVDVFTPDECKAFLGKRVPTVSDSDVRRLAESLGHLPLAIEQAAALRVETGMAVDEYLRLLADKRIELLSEGLSLDYPETVGAAWNVSLDKVAEENPAALQLLQLCAYLGPTPNFRDVVATAPDSRITDDLDHIRLDPIRLSRAVQDLTRYALVEIGDGPLRMHTLVQAVVKHRMTDDERSTMRRGAERLLRPEIGTPSMSARTQRVGVVIMTALNLECRAICNHLGNQVHRDVAGTIFRIGEVADSGSLIAVAVLGPGTAGAAALTERALSEFKPDALLFTGVAGALKSHIEINDVVVATKVYGYHGGKEEGDSFKARPEAWPASHRLEQIARDVELTGSWTKLIPPDEKYRDREPQVHFGPIASGDVVVNSRDLSVGRQIEGNFNDTLAVEMESAGSAKAAHLRNVPTLTIRGISDQADGGKHVADATGSQVKAAANAAAFTIALIGRLSSPGH